MGQIGKRQNNDFVGGQMSILDKIKSGAAAAIDAVENKMDCMINHQFVQATIAFLALIVAADGTIEDSERRRVASVISQNDRFKSSNKQEVIDLFHNLCDKLTKDFVMEKINCLSMISKMKGKAESDEILRLGILIAKSGSDFGDPEKAIISEVCNILGLNFKDFVN